MQSTDYIISVILIVDMKLGENPLNHAMYRVTSAKIVSHDEFIILTRAISHEHAGSNHAHDINHNK